MGEGALFQFGQKRILLEGSLFLHIENFPRVSRKYTEVAYVVPESAPEVLIFRHHVTFFPFIEAVRPSNMPVLTFGLKIYLASDFLKMIGLDWRGSLFFTLAQGPLLKDGLVTGIMVAQSN